MVAFMQKAIEAQARVVAAQDQLHAATTDRNLAISEAHAEGFSVIRIAAELGLSRQQVHKIITATMGESCE